METRKILTKDESIGLQMGVGYTVGYLVYTIGTLVTAPASLNVAAAIAGLAVAAIFVGVVWKLIRNTEQNRKAEYALKNESNKNGNAAHLCIPVLHKERNQP